ncbi:MAG: structural protein P5 [Bacteroidaceae bacterium]|nr:structural protein P5 [Bacteroidaceae bacterium]
MTRGERNNNPLNIRRSAKTRWMGQCKMQRDREFVQFISRLFGYRAAFRILRTYINSYGLRTLRQLIGRWAPPEDGNDTESYVAQVSRRSGVDAARQLSFGDKDALVDIVVAMAWVESVVDEDRDLVERAYYLA